MELGEQELQYLRPEPRAGDIGAARVQDTTPFQLGEKADQRISWSAPLVSLVIQ